MSLVSSTQVYVSEKKAASKLFNSYWGLFEDTQDSPAAKVVQRPNLTIFKQKPLRVLAYAQPMLANCSIFDLTGSVKRSLAVPSFKKLLFSK